MANQSVMTRPSNPHSSRRRSTSRVALLGEPPAVQPVVGRHDPERAALLHRQLEGQQVQLAQGALVDHRADRAALELGVVAHEVLRPWRPRRWPGRPARSPRPARPESSGILRVALEVAPGERGAVEVDRRGEQAPATPVEGLAADQRAELLHQLGVPRRPEGRAARDAGRRRRRPCPGRPDPRAPFGPSVTLTRGMPSRSTAAVATTGRARRERMPSRRGSAPRGARRCPPSVRRRARRGWTSGSPVTRRRCGRWPARRCRGSWR